MSKTQNKEANPEEILDLCEDNPLLWGKLFLPHHFRDPSGDFHMEIIESCQNHRYVAIQAPRESAKSTIAAFLYVFHQMVHKKVRFVVIVQNTFTKSKETLNAIKDEIKNNPQIKKLYNIDVKRDMEGDSIFVHEDDHAIRVLCKGAEQIGSVRGEKFGAYRPDLILIDDLEDDDMVKNPERRADLQKQYDEALVPAGDRHKCQHIAIGTILHDDCLMARLVSTDYYPEYYKLFYTARFTNSKTNQLESLWEEKWTLEQLNQLEKDKPEVFAKEYQGDPSSGILKKINASDFRRWRIENDEYVLFDSENNITSRGSLSDCRAAIGYDAAWEEKKVNDFSAIVPVYITPNSDILVEDYIAKRGMRPNETEETVFLLEARLKSITHKTVSIGMEKAKLEKVMKWWFSQAMRRRNHFLNLKDIPWVSDKIARITTTLQARYEMHSIFHKQGMGDLENQLVRIASTKHDDIADALQLAVRCLSFSPNKKKVTKGSNDPKFEWLRSKILKKRNPGKYIFGKKSTRMIGIPAKESWS